MPVKSAVKLGALISFLRQLIQSEIISICGSIKKMPSNHSLQRIPTLFFIEKKQASQLSNIERVPFNIRASLSGDRRILYRLGASYGSKDSIGLPWQYPYYN